MRKYVLIGGSLAAVLLITFLVGMQLGQAQMYDFLTFGNVENEVYINVAYHDDDVLIKRYRNNNLIGILDSIAINEAGLEQLRQQLEAALAGIPGLDTYEIADNELMLFKLENFQWEAILQKVLDVVRSN